MSATTTETEVPAELIEETEVEFTPAEETEEAPTQTTPSDDEIRAAIEREIASRQRASASRPRTAISETFQSMVALVASSTGKRYPGGIPKVSEATGLKVLELSLMWALNNQNGNLPPILPSDAPESGDEGEEPLLDPDGFPIEVITGSDDSTEA